MRAATASAAPFGATIRKSREDAWRTTVAWVDSEVYPGMHEVVVWLFEEQLAGVQAAFRTAGKSRWERVYKAVTVVELLSKTGAAVREPLESGALVERYIPVLNVCVNNQAQEAYQFGMQFDLDNIFTSDWYRRTPIQFAQQPTETTEEVVREIIHKGDREGWSLARMQQALTNTFETWLGRATQHPDLDWIAERLNPGRVEMIARTESMRAANAAKFAVGVECGIQDKEWVTAIDGRERPAHREADGQIVKMQDAFVVGGEQMMFPGDPSASVGNVVNCRCTVVYVIPEEEEWDEEGEELEVEGEPGTAEIPIPWQKPLHADPSAIETPEQLRAAVRQSERFWKDVGEGVSQELSAAGLAPEIVEVDHKKAAAVRLTRRLLGGDFGKVVKGLLDVARGNTQGYSPEELRALEVLELGNRLEVGLDLLTPRRVSGITPETSSVEEATRGLAAGLIQSWARTSAGNDVVSLAVQWAASQEFGVEVPDRFVTRPGWKRGQEAIGGEYAPLGGALRQFVRGMYDEAQAELQRQGIREIWLWRGVDLPGNAVTEGRVAGTEETGRADMRLQPLSSFATTFESAKSFGRMIFGTLVPAERIIAFPGFGSGCLGEDEFVVLGGEGQAYYSRKAHMVLDFDIDWAGRVKDIEDG